jgi:hypothetical protein
MPDGELVTVPDPVPARVTVSVGVLDEPVADPDTLRVMVSPPAVKLTLETKLERLVGRKRTTTAWLAPPARVKDPPETMLNGAPTLALPDTVALVVFWTVNGRSSTAPSRMLPNATAPVGETLIAPRAAALATAEHPLSFPAVSTAVIRTEYVVPALRPVMVDVTVWFAVGVLVDDDTA